MKPAAATESQEPLWRDAPNAPAQQERSYLFEYRRQIRGLLAMLRAIIRRTARNAQSVEEYAAVLEGRLGALARVQDMLMRMPEGGADLLELVSAEFLAQGVADHRVAVKGLSLPLSSKVAASMALALHELTANAIKFGALSASHGLVSVDWQEIDSGFTRLEWHEAGVPVVLTSPRASGFGMELLEKTLPYEIGARTSVELAPGGLTWSIEFRARRERAEVP